MKTFVRICRNLAKQAQLSIHNVEHILQHEIEYESTIRPMIDRYVLTELM